MLTQKQTPDFAVSPSCPSEQRRTKRCALTNLSESAQQTIVRRLFLIWRMWGMLSGIPVEKLKMFWGALFVSNASFCTLYCNCLTSLICWLQLILFFLCPFSLFPGQPRERRHCTMDNLPVLRECVTSPWLSLSAIGPERSAKSHAIYSCSGVISPSYGYILYDWIFVNVSTV